MNVSELTLLVLRVGFLILLWAFVFVIVYALRSDLFGPRVRKLPDAGAPLAPPAGPVPAAAPFAASAPVAPLPPATDPFSLFDEPDARDGADAAIAAVAAASSLAGLAHDRTGTTGPQPTIPPARPQTGARQKATLFTASRLVVTSGPLAGTELELTPAPLTIGRSADSGLVVRDDYTSTHHARLMLWNNEWMLQDLDSTNGTLLDGERVTAPTQVPLDTPIKIGLTTFELRR